MSAIELPDSDYDGDFPSHLVDPKKKDDKWLLQYAKAAYARHRKNQTLNTRRGDWIDARRYAQGNQSVTKYQKWATRLKDAEGRPVSYMDLNWGIVSVIPKFRNILKGYFSKLQYAVSCTAINPEAGKDREKAKAQLWAAQQLKGFFGDLEKKTGVKFGESVEGFIPETKEELELFFNLAFQLQSEISMEIGERMVFYENAWEDIAEQLWEDIIDLGCLGCCTYVDPISNRIKLRYCDPPNMLIDEFRGHDGSVLERIGEFRMFTIQQLKLTAGNQFTEQQYYDLAYKNRGQYGNADNLSPFADYINTDATLNGFYPYDNFQILVLECYLDSCDRHVGEKKMVKGVQYSFKKPFNTKLGSFGEQLNPSQYPNARTDESGRLYEKIVDATDLKTVYGFHWIVGTDHLFNSGKVYNISRPKENQKECFKPMKFYRVAHKSTVEKMIPLADSYHMSWLKVQNLKARAMPKGIMIEIGAFENVALDGKILTARELLEVAVQSGIIIYRKGSTQDDDGYDNTSDSPVTETKGGLGAEFQELINSMATDIMTMRDVSGISEIFDASAQDPKQLVGTAELALVGTQNALSPLIKGFTWIYEKTAVDVSLKLQELARNGKIKGYVPALGSNVGKIIEIGSEISFANMGIKLEALPTEEQKRRIMQVAQLALESVNDPTKGGIDFSDYLAIGRMIDDGKTKLAEAFLAYKIRKFKEETQAMAERNMQVQGQEQQKLEVVKADKSKEVLLFSTEQAKDVDNNKADNEIRVMREKYKLEKELNASKTVDKVAENNLSESPVL